ncbi:glycosyltransferase family 4 protein [Candidatus Woesearchaeota archaeon]|nr:glycosyltransferase family 4 protein [Candidatus Woesearchaeota archaeon]
MRILMFGWEFPPLSSGGLGTACYGLTKALANRGVDITFVVPYAVEGEAEFVKLVSTSGIIKVRRINTLLKPYMSSKSYGEVRRKAKGPSMYGQSLFDEVWRYMHAAEKIAEEEDFDVIHCHDWMTFQAGIMAKKKKHKPLVVHVHATEFDRTGDTGVNQHVYEIERKGMHAADAIIAVSNYTKNKITRHYGIAPDKIHVVHNAVERSEKSFSEISALKKDNKIVLFVGRITLQKGPDYFLYAAKKVLEHNKNVRFIMVGSGDMEPFIVEKAAELGIADKFLFAGFLQGDELHKAYQMADVYVLPSVSEPFGITPLESMANNTPVIISKQSGVSEVINHCLKVDFWDIDQLSSKILSVLNYKALHEELRDNASLEVRKLSWDIPAQKCIHIYNQVLERNSIKI